MVVSMPLNNKAFRFHGRPLVELKFYLCASTRTISLLISIASILTHPSYLRWMVRLTGSFCLLEAVPISINGIGLRDAGYLMFFTAVGLAGRGADPATASGTLSLCYMAFTLAYACGGGLLFLRRLFASRT